MVAIEHDALKRFVKATEEFEARFGAVVMGLPGPISGTGDPYSEYINGKPAKEGGREIEQLASPDAAIEATFSRLLKAHPANPALTLHWRIKPEIDYIKRSTAEGGYAIYCRFLLSDKPAVTPNG
jgi:hypothetical protein